MSAKESKYYNVVHCVHILLQSMKKQKTTTRTLRISEELDNLLERDSTDKRVSTNSLINSILTKYAEWNRYTEKVGFISLPRDGFKLIINSVDEQEIKKLAEEVGSRQPQELLMFWFKKRTLDVFLEGLSLYCRYGGIAKCEVETSGGECTIALHHEINKKWSTFVGYLMTQGMKDMLNIIPKFEVTEHSVVFRFPVPSIK
jgi:hypothetical protein